MILIVSFDYLYNSLVSTGFHRSIYRYLQVSIGIYKYLQVSTGICRYPQLYLHVSTGIYKYLQVSKGIYKYLQVSIGISIHLSSHFCTLCLLHLHLHFHRDLLCLQQEHLSPLRSIGMWRVLSIVKLPGNGAEFKLLKKQIKKL